MKNTAERIYHTILNANQVLLIPHQHPDGDALGSVAAMMQWLREIGKPHMVFCKTEVTERMRYLPHTNYIVSDESLWQREPFDVVIVFDSGDTDYAGITPLLESMPKKPTVINIDHHVSNVFFGDLNMVNVKASSTSEVLYEFFRVNALPIEGNTATCLLTGILYDTNNFTNAATTERSLTIASELIRRGADLHFVRRALFQDKSLGTLKLWGIALSRLEKHDDLDLVHTFIRREDLELHGVSDKDTEGIANLLTVLGDGKASMIMREVSGGQVKTSLRTTRDDVDVSRLAGFFGGGGHQKSAGFTIQGSLEEVREQFLHRVAAEGGIMTPVLAEA